MKTFYYNIAGHQIGISFADEWNNESLLPSFAPFVCEGECETVLSVTVDDSFRFLEKGEEVGQFDCGGCNHGVYRLTDGSYQYEISDLSKTIVSYVQCNADFSNVKVALTGADWKQRNYGLNNALMLSYAFACVEKDTLLVHASVVRYDGRGVLCLGKSGTGKSTHTRLWLEHIEGTDLMNDDNPVVRYIDGQTLVFGSPWSGKTSCYRKVQAPVAAFLRIEQKPENTIRQERGIAAFAGILPTASCMKWDHRIHNGICNTVSRIVAVTPYYVLGCRPDSEAAELSNRTIFNL